MVLRRLSRLRASGAKASTTPVDAGNDARPNERLIFEEARRAVDSQSAQSDSLDTKAGLVAATATALLAGFLALSSGIGSTVSANHQQRITLFTVHLSTNLFLTILFTVAFLSYLFVIGSLFFAVGLRDWWNVGDPAALVEIYWDQPVDQTLANLSATMAETFNHNRDQINDKITWVGRGFIFLGVEVVILFLGTLASVWAGLL